MIINIKRRFHNKTFCISFIAACILLLQQLGLGEYLPGNLMDIANSILTLLCMLGIVVDPTTQGLSDSSLVMQDLNSDEVLEKAKEK